MTDTSAPALRIAVVSAVGVAQILAYIYSLKRRGARVGV